MPCDFPAACSGRANPFHSLAGLNEASPDVNVTLLRIGNLCGILAPLLWAFAIILCGELRPEYSHFTQYISELGERGSSTEFLMRYAGFVPTGLMHMAFAAFLYFAVRGGRLTVIAAMLVGLNGLARIGAGLFPCEPGCVSPKALLSQQLHSLSAGIGFFAIIAASVVWGLIMRRHQRLRELSLYSVGCGALGLVFLLLMVRSDELRAGTGLYERLSSGVLSLWLLVFAAGLWRQGADGVAVATVNPSLQGTPTNRRL